MTQIFYCSTFFSALELCAALDVGCFGPHTERRLLITSTNAAVPEISARVDDTPGFDEVRARFDDVVQWNDVIAPMHPSGWEPPAAEVPMLSRWLRTQLGVHDEVHDVAVESIAVAPARTIAALLPDATITVLSDGLMSYGPTRNALPGEIATRVERLLYLELVPRLQPLLLRETHAHPHPISFEAFAKVLSSVPVPADIAEATGCPMIIGQYLSALGLLTPVQETEQHAQMLRALVARGHRRIVFKPHPAAGRAHVRPMRSAAAELGVELVVAEQADSAEVWFVAAKPALVVSCFSTALFSASRFFDLPVATLGCGDVLKALRPYQNSNRIPATIVDATIARLAPDGSLHDPPSTDIGALVRAVGYCMQPVHGAALRTEAQAYVRANGPARYFNRRRLEKLGLISTPRRRLPRARRAYRRARNYAAAVRERRAITSAG